MLSELEIIKGCQNNDRKAQELLFKKYHPPLLGICYRYSANTEEAKDILQEGFIKIFNYIKTFREESSLATWMSKIIINTAITQYNKNLDYKSIISLNDSMKDPAVFDDIPYQEFSTDEILGAIQELPDEFRTVINLYAIEGFRHKEISKMLNISESNSKIRYLRAKKLLLEKMNNIKDKKDSPFKYKLSIG